MEMIVPYLCVCVCVRTVYYWFSFGGKQFKNRLLFWAQHTGTVC